MNTQAILQADYLDLVFHNRNKQYGGYELRRNYNRRAGMALGLMLGGTLALCAFTALKPKTIIEPASTHLVMKEVDLQRIHIPTPQVPPPPAPPAPPAPAAAPAPTTTFTPPVIVADTRVQDPMPTARDLANTQPGNSNSTGGGEAPGGTGDKTFGNVQPPAVVTPPITRPLDFAEVMPAYDGDMAEYLRKQLRYPEAARSNNIEGRVLVQFVVDEGGNITNAKVLRGIGHGCDEEALRVVNAMKPWKPGMQSGKKVKVLLTLPIRFILQ